MTCDNNDRTQVYPAHSHRTKRSVDDINDTVGEDNTDDLPKPKRVAHDTSSTDEDTVEDPATPRTSEKGVSLSPPRTSISIETPNAPMAASTRLRLMLQRPNHIVACPGVYDGLSGRIAIEVGFEAMYMTGAGTTASRLGQADLGIAQLSDMRGQAEMIANLDTTVPLIADMDTGYGGPIMVARSVSEYIRAGVAAFHIEDQIQQKRCGHLKGKQVVDVETYVARIQAARMAIDKVGSDIVLIGRTDALQQHGYDEAVARLRAAKEAGADVGLLEGVTSKEMARRAIEDLAPMPLLLNMVENGATPVITVEEARLMGYKIMIFSFAALAPAYQAIKETFERLKREGVTGIGKTDLTPRKMFEVCGLKESMEIDESAGGKLVGV